MTFNSNNFNLTNWKLTLPIDKNGGLTGEALEILNLANYESKHFYDAPDGAMVFSAYANGATTSGSTYARSELREMNGSKLAAWNLKTGGTMTATLKVDQVAKLNDGTNGRIIVGQIHGQDEELIRLYWDKNTVYFMNDQAGPKNQETKFTFKNASGQEPNISLGEKFSYKIDARGNTMIVEIYADGQKYTSVSELNSVWQSDTFYFKAGAYMGVKESTGSGLSQVSFYGLDFGHTLGSGLGGLNPTQNPNPNPEPNPNPPTQPSQEIAGTSNSETIIGTNKADTIRANAGNDTVRGANGNDTIYGDNGNDTLYGDVGNDIIHGGAGNDQITGGVGNDIAIGGAGRDSFVVARGDNGLVIEDFTTGSAGDSLLLKGYTAAELALAQMSQSGSDVVLRLSDGAQVIFQDVTLSQMASAQLQAQVNNTVIAFVPGKPVIPPVTPTPNEPETSASQVGTNGNDRIDGEDDDNDVIAGRGGHDTIDGRDGNDRLSGEDGNDKLYGNDDHDYLNGGAANDVLYGEDGKDTLLGDVGSDALYGGSGDDILNGGAGQDYLHGGKGDDTFVFDKIPDIHDILSDFDVGDDKLDIETLLGNNGIASIKTVSGESGLYVDADGSGSAKAVLVAVFEDKVSSNDLSEIFV